MKLLATPTWMSARLRGRQGHARTGCGAAVARLAARLSMLGLFAATPALAAGVFFVNKSSPTCSDAGPGTEAQPYCTISGALAARGGPGTTIRVKPGLYRESVTVPVSGASGDPLIIQATGGTVNIDGAEDFSSTSLWAPVSGDVWLASSVTWGAVQQVFVDGQRLMASTADPALLPAGTFRYMLGTGLYVNAGGGNPGAHQTLVGRRQYGFLLSGRSWVTIEGFHITRAEQKGILAEQSDNIAVVSDTATFCASDGIAAFNCTDVLIEKNQVFDNAYHGISLRLGTTASTVQDNESFRNDRPGERIANGIYLNGSPGNLIQRNRLHHNGDTGLEIQSGSDNCVSIQNISWSNGDHGFQHIFTTGTTDVGNVAWGNHTDGFSVEGNATGTSLFDCIAVDNGLTANELDLYVDPGSIAGFTSDYNLFWNSTSLTPIKYNGVRYATIAAYNVASGQDGHSIQNDPKFVDPGTGDFHLRSGSPAIDCADSSVPLWPAADAEGRARMDDLATPNTGTGPIPFADRGALEFATETTAVGDPVGPGGVSLSSAFPSPSQGQVFFTLDLPREARVEWSVHDLQGRTIWSGSRTYGAGRHLLSWAGLDGSRPGSPKGGIYFARFEVDRRSFARRLILLL